MAKKKKRFIDKNNSITFKLVERNQKDPLFVDETAPNYVLIEKKTKQKIHLDDDNDRNSKKLSDIKRREEQIRYGIYFDDDYNYLQHLIDVNEVSIPNGIELVPKNEEKQKSRIMLPSSVFTSAVEEKEDLNVKAALPVGPQLDWDPDIVEAMDDDFDFDDPNNQIDDDFVIQAMKSNDDNDDNQDSSIGDYKKQNKQNIMEEDLEEEYESDDNLSMCGYNGSDDDIDEIHDKFNFDPKLMTKKNVKRFFGIDNQEDNQTIKTTASHFTEYSMSSSIVPRNENLRLLDEKFEKMFIREYADEIGIGALDSEEIKGEINPNRSELINKLIQEFQDFKLSARQEYEPNEFSINYVRKHFKEFKSIDEEEEQSSSESEREEIEIIDSSKGNKDRFDCESILSVYSNTQNYPKILKNPPRIKHINTRAEVPIRLSPAQELEFLDKKKIREDQNETKSVKSNMSRLSELSFRPKDETCEQRKQRKKELKEFRAQRRMEKKANRLAFNEEKLRLHKVELNKAFQKKIYMV